jgi:hypothetical protein
VVAAVVVALGGGAGAFLVLANGDKPRATAGPPPAPGGADATTTAEPLPVVDGETPSTTPTSTTPEPVTTTRGEPTSKPATAPENTMRRHLEALADQNYSAAFAEFSTGPGGSSESSWTQTARGYDAAVAPGPIDEVGRDGGIARVHVSFYSHDSGDAPGATGPHRCAWFHGIVYVVDRGGRWLYEPQSEGRTDLSKDFIPASDPRCAPLLR